ISYQETAPSGSSTTDSFFFRASDPAGNQTSTILFHIDITPHDQPVDETTPAKLAAVANLATSVAGVRVVDDSLQNENYTVVIAAGTGILTAADNAVAITGSGTGSLSFTGTLTALNAALASVDYRGTVGGPDTI